MSPLKTKDGISFTRSAADSIDFSVSSFTSLWFPKEKNKKKLSLRQFTKATRRNFYYSAVPFFSSSYFDKFL